jgi:hypothetical protein
MQYVSSAWVVQDRESGAFLVPCAGDVSFVKYLVDAGQFESREEAIETAIEHCSRNFNCVLVMF